MDPAEYNDTSLCIPRVVVVHKYDYLYFLYVIYSLKEKQN